MARVNDLVGALSARPDRCPSPRRRTPGTGLSVWHLLVRPGGARARAVGRARRVSNAVLASWRSVRSSTSVARYPRFLAPTAGHARFRRPRVPARPRGRPGRTRAEPARPFAPSRPALPAAERGAAPWRVRARHLAPTAPRAVTAGRPSPSTRNSLTAATSALACSTATAAASTKVAIQDCVPATAAGPSGAPSKRNLAARRIEARLTPRTFTDSRLVQGSARHSHSRAASSAQ